MKINSIFFLGSVFFVFFFFLGAVPNTQAQSTLNVSTELCERHGSCNRFGCWAIGGDSQAGICRESGRSCCVRSDVAGGNLLREHIQTTITDPDLQRQALENTLASATANASGSDSGTPQSTGSLQYTLLEKVPGTDGLGSDLKGYLEAMYRLALILVTLSAVFMISVGGFMYLTSAGNTSQASSAKSVITDALIGLVIALVAWLILYVINPELANPRVPTLKPAVSTGTNLGSNPVLPPTPGTGTPGTCGGLTPQSGIRCEDASSKLSDLLACMKGKGITASVSSIGDSAGFATCKNDWTGPKCAHAEKSCHYGGGKAQTAAECQKSQAADISIKNARGDYDQSIATAIQAAATACGGRVKDESNIRGVTPHMHVSTQTTCCNL